MAVKLEKTKANESIATGLNALGFAKPPAETRVVVAMSGGVDSSVTAVTDESTPPDMATTTRVSAGGLAKPSALRPVAMLSFALVFSNFTAIISSTHHLGSSHANHQAHPTFQSGTQGAMSAQGLAQTSRLGCQIEMSDALDGLRVTIPDDV